MTAVVEDSGALGAEGISKRYGDRVALRDISFRLEAGERLAVIGPNGAGKTTLLQILAGVLAPSGGRVSLQPTQVGWVPQHPALYKKLSVAENLRLFARLEGVGDVRDTVERMLSQSGLSERRDDEVGRLSGGNQQRVNIAIGLLRSPSALLLDEPTASLDPRQRSRLWEFIGGLAADGTAVLFSTHDVAEAERHGDRVLVLADGQPLFCGTARELERVAGTADFEAAFVALLRERGH